MTAAPSEQDDERPWQAQLDYEVTMWQALDERHRQEQSQLYLHEINQAERARLTASQASERKVLQQQLRAQRIAWRKSHP